jgi:hypothetical protein
VHSCQNPVLFGTGFFSVPVCLLSLMGVEIYDKMNDRCLIHRLSHTVAVSRVAFVFI